MLGWIGLLMLVLLLRLLMLGVAPVCMAIWLKDGPTTGIASCKLRLIKRELLKDWRDNNVALP